MRTKKEILEEIELLSDENYERLLTVLGFVPVIGQIADIALIFHYLRRGQNLYAGLMLIALVPGVGNLVAAPFIALLKGAGKIRGVGKSGTLLIRNGDQMVNFLNKNPKLKKQYLKLEDALDSPLVNQSIQKVNRVSSSMGEKLKTSIAEHRSILDRLKTTRPAGLAKSIGKEVSAGGKVSTGIKKFFQDEKLSQYIAKNGMAPKTWVSNWWHVVYKGSLERRNSVKKFIIANNILSFLGLKSIGQFEKNMENEDYRANIAKNPAFSDMVGKQTTPEDLAKIEGEYRETGKGALSGIEGAMGIAMLKSLAKGIV